MGNYKLFSFFSLLFIDQQKTTKTKKRGREGERQRERRSVLDRAYEEKYCTYDQQGIGVNEKDYNRKFLDELFSFRLSRC